MYEDAPEPLGSFPKFYDRKVVYECWSHVRFGRPSTAIIRFENVRSYPAPQNVYTDGVKNEAVLTRNSALRLSRPRHTALFRIFVGIYRIFTSDLINSSTTKNKFYMNIRSVFKIEEVVVYEFICK